MVDLGGTKKSKKCPLTRTYKIIIVLFLQVLKTSGLSRQKKMYFFNKSFVYYYLYYHYYYYAFFAVAFYMVDRLFFCKFREVG